MRKVCHSYPNIILCCSLLVYPSLTCQLNVEYYLQIIFTRCTTYVYYISVFFETNQIPLHKTAVGYYWFRLIALCC